MDPPTARLEVVAGNAAGLSLLVADELLVGRHATGAGRLAGDGEISRSHARITVESSGFCAIEDLGSTNGTFVNGLRVSGPRTLAEGDTIEMGASTLVVRELPPVSDTPTVRSPAPQPTPVAGSATGVTADPGPPADRGAFTGLAAVPGRGVTAPSPDVAPLRLSLEVDFAAREARILLDGASEPVRVRLDDGVWRLARESPG